MKGVPGTSPHGSLRYRRGCRCLTCRREESLRVRAAYERACITCGGPTWGLRCAECRRRDATTTHRVQRDVGMRYLRVKETTA